MSKRLRVSRIFIVEDHPKMRETYALFLARVPDLELCGMVATGAEALAHIPAADPHLVVVDLSLPDVDGVQLVQQLREQFPRLPILVVSGYHANQFADRITASGANGYLNKQHAYSSLVPLIRELLASPAADSSTQ